MTRKMDVAHDGMLTMAEATHSEKMQVMGTDTTTMISVLRSAPRKTLSWNNSM